ncbi:MAG: YciI family protein [Streptosporangiaceae bacterium]
MTRDDTRAAGPADGRAGAGPGCKSAGAWVSAGGLHPPSTATVVRVQDGGMLITNGPFAVGKEHIGGFWVIKAKDLDAALEW